MDQREWRPDIRYWFPKGYEYEGWEFYITADGRKHPKTGRQTYTPPELVKQANEHF